jgi:AhpD family alkylhydroperoxidase
MDKIQVFDPAMCCNTGVCGPEVDPSLVTFAADLEWLNAQGTQVERINLAQQPQLFAQHDAIRHLLETQGEAALPAIVVNGEIKQCGRYPSREQLAEWAHLPSEMSLFTDEVAELVALGAAIASNCEPCFKFHYDQARKLGVTDADMRRAVDLARQVKEAPNRGVLDLANRYLNKQSTPTTISVTAASDPKSEGGCCAPAPGRVPAASAKCC